VTAAALRETREEVGLELPRERLRIAGVMHRLSSESRIDFFFSCELADETPENREPEKCSELVWARPDSLPPDTIAYVRAALANFAAGHWFEEHGWPDG
ncbi:MAG: NUDIX domain-containing protein, partial [Myxococcota bacterium]